MDRTARVTLADWRETNRAYLKAALRRIRLLLQRRVLWLRQLWKQDPLQGYQGMVWLIAWELSGWPDWAGITPMRGPGRSAS